MVEPIWACTLCGYCDAICPSGVHNVEIVLHLRRELRRTPAQRPARPQRAHSVRAARRRWCSAARSASARRISSRRSTSSCGASAGRRAAPTRRAAARSRSRPAARCRRASKAGVVADPVCLEQYDAEFLGVLAMQHLDLFDLEPPFYYYAPHRLVNRDHARVYPLYDELRRRFGCDMNFDLNRLARSTSAGSVQGLSGRDARDIPAAVARLLAHSRAERIITCSPADYLAFKAYSGRETLLHHGVPALSEITTDVLIIGASLAGAAAAKRTVDAGFQHDHHRAEGRCRATRSAPASSRRAATRSCARISASRPTTRSTRRSGSPASTSCSPTACSCRCRSSRDRRRTSIASTPTTTS